MDENVCQSDSSSACEVRWSGMTEAMNAAVMTTMKKVVNNLLP
jgi:hypothetical protein